MDDLPLWRDPSDAVSLATRQRTGVPAFSVVVPAYNEAAVLPAFQQRLAAVMDRLGAAWEVVYVDDGSADGTAEIVRGLKATRPEVALLALSRNFGKEAALTAGLDHARGSEAVIVIDADLQDPPEVIPALVAAWREGAEVVYAQRRSRAGETWLKRATAHAFYRVMGRIAGPVKLPADTGDFRLMSRRAVDALLRLRERHRFMKGLFAWVGFPSRAVLYDREPRAAGSTKWNYRKLWALSLEGITSFTTLPLRVATWLGLGTAAFALLFGGWVVLKALLYGDAVPGYPSLMAVVLMLGGVQLITLGVIGEYLGRIFNETKGRPLYIVGRHLPSGAERE
ncbi:glycosyltransferase family 2 protein [Paracraurococcus lichenis]|uniref:Glycosyltransferase family 2 protein n=1 Tax=Paracraurococcus lichenis TaxID=3064888 RepID=A0ABT9DSU7_9PROT|nr:glycosyltransferase family 2 protein [Paracraurococcus sp. LOR1-02]MDO9706964.1 glycosyltransferase family 2 protein [Paracraurococcus sp. LOR1-02]